MKTAYKATGKRFFTFHFMWIIGFGYNKEYYHYDEHSCQEFVSFYIPFCHINATQHFRKFEK